MEQVTFESQLQKLKSLLRWTTHDLIYITSLINSIKSFKGNIHNQEHWTEIFNLWYELVAKVPIPKTEIDVNYIVRARPNEVMLFSEEWEISYNSRYIDKIGWGRFNCPKESFFYGAAPIILASDNTSQRHFICSTLEACKDITNTNCTTPYFDLTLGIWRVNTPFMLVNLCFDEKHLKANPRYEKGLSQLIEGIQSVASREVYEIVKSIWQLMSNCSCVKCGTEQDYLVSTAMFKAICIYYDHIGETVHGLSYPSTMTEHEGENVVLTSHAVDSYLTLKEVFMYRYHRDEDKKSYSIYPISNIASVANKRYTLQKYSEERMAVEYQLMRQAIGYK